MNDKLTARFRGTRTLGSRDRDELFALYARSIDVERSAFEAAIDSADRAIEYRDGRDVLRGMALVRAYDVEHEGRRQRVIWTGSVLIEPEYRGQSAIETSAIVYLAREMVRAPTARHVWFFDTFSYKSYALMARNFGEFWPRPDREMPDDERSLLDRLARERYGSRWDPARGVASSAGKRMREGVAPVPSRTSDPWISYFARTNPTYADGTVLVCLCPLDRANLSVFARRLAARTWRGTLRSAAKPQRPSTTAPAM
ncbi:hypothetical protein [Sandaracinus amylolyticus]|uniref:N-acetyltransferase domain-containing protein n=1 Tax=Sandaracinus amylolyticus TaxID=927083 RepID=A0A0F6YPQ7_9BACT|nr:hypothetical protein [Sandaracinus amylolyticus]AKF11722.1 hypothetical protein DB32_008871 [Sandaracinus amylolyticus]